MIAPGPAGRGAPPEDLQRTIDGYLLHLRVERGLAPLTIGAYATDLRAFARDAPQIEAWATSAEPARAYLAGLTRPPRALRPTSHRRKAASIRAFYRFAYGDDWIAVDVAGALDLPRQARRLPDVLDPAEVVRLLEAVPMPTGPPRTAGEAVAIRDRALLELLYASVLRIGEALGLDRDDLSLDGGYVRVLGTGRSSGRPDALAWPSTSRRTPCGTALPRTCWRAVPTCASSRSCSDMRALRPRSSTRT
jgi:integrase/recombinase XerD